MVRRRLPPIYDGPVFDPELGRWVQEDERAEKWYRKREAQSDFRTLRHPFFWLYKARDLHAAARFLWETYAAGGSTTLFEEYPRIDSYPEIAFMLAGLALENCIKAIVLCRATRPISDADMKEITAGSHDLDKFIQVHKIQSSKGDREVLAILSRYVRWAGRYTLPKAADELVEHRSSNSLSDSEIWSEYIRLHGKFFGRAKQAVDRSFAS